MIFICGDIMLESFNRFKLCYTYSDKIIRIYTKIFIMGLFNDNELVNKLKEFIDIENEFYEDLTINDIQYFFKNMKKIDTDNHNLSYLRFRNKIMYIANKHNGYKLSLSELDFEDKYTKKEFDIFSLIIAMIDIKSLKLVKKKINNLNIDNINDKKFVIELKNNFEKKLWLESFGNDVIENVLLFNDMDIDKVPNIDINLLIKSVLSKNKDLKDNRIYDVIFDMAENTIKIILSYGYYKNNPEDIFNYLYLITRLDVIISYLDKDYLDILSEYCNYLTKYNKTLVNNINVLIKKKSKDLGDINERN